MAKNSKTLKSAYELAMERLEAEDTKKGLRRKALTGKQKQAIGEARAAARAKLAELQILHRDKLAEIQDDPERAAELKEMEEHYEIDRRRIESDLESKIERIKND